MTNKRIIILISRGRDHGVSLSIVAYNITNKISTNSKCPKLEKLQDFYQGLKN
jgi:hypothetical protein